MSKGLDLGKSFVVNSYVGLPSATYFFSAAKKSKQKMPSLKCREG
jgi:hypothetical protein